MTYTELFSSIYGTIEGLPVIAVGVFVFDGSPSWVVIDDDGLIRHVPLGAFTADVRFVDGEWKDTSPGALDAEEA